MTTMDPNLTHYVFHHFGYLMTTYEKWAYKHLASTLKATMGRSDVSAQEEAKAYKTSSHWLSDDPNVLRLASDGFEEFKARTAQRILEEHGDQVFLNRCPQCDALARTPTARQCRFCGHDWH